MKQLKTLGLAAVAAAALTALLAPGAAATTLEVGGTTENESIGISVSLKSGTSTVFKDTFGITINTCTSSETGGTTATPYTGTTVTGPISILSWSKCTREAITVNKTGTLHIEHIPGTTNGTLTSSGTEFTTPSPFGPLTCKTGEGAHIGTLTGTGDTKVHAEIHINATIPCAISAKWTATYLVTSPTGLGVSA